MKKILLLSLAFLSMQQLIAQEDTLVNSYEKKNEVKLNGVMLLIGAFEVAYEQNLNNDSSAGISVFIPFDREVFNDELNFYVSPYYRVYFSKKYAAGFFVEGFGMFSSMKIEEYYYAPNGAFSSYSEENYSDFALGLGVGGKWVTKRGIVFELVGGVGRNLFNTDATDISIVGKFGFNLGYRF